MLLRSDKMTYTAECATHRPINRMDATNHSLRFITGSKFVRTMEIRNRTTLFRLEERLVHRMLRHSRVHILKSVGSVFRYFLYCRASCQETFIYLCFSALILLVGIYVAAKIIPEDDLLCVSWDFKLTSNFVSGACCVLERQRGMDVPNNNNNNNNNNKKKKNMCKAP